MQMAMPSWYTNIVAPICTLQQGGRGTHVVGDISPHFKI